MADIGYGIGGTKGELVGQEEDLKLCGVLDTQLILVNFTAF